MPEYHMVMSEEFAEVVNPNVFDHWAGETIPLRGPDRRIIGEATVVSVDHREDGTVSVVVSSDIDMGFDNAAHLADVMRGRESMSFKVQEPDPAFPLLDALVGKVRWQWTNPAPPVQLPHQPRRDDDVARWLKAKRDEQNRRHDEWFAIDAILDEYRARADYGLTLDDDMSELEGRW